MNKRKGLPKRARNDFPLSYTAPLCTGRIEDITTYCPRGARYGKGHYSHHGQIDLHHSGDVKLSGNVKLTRSGRAMVASAFAGEYLSITLRGGKDSDPVEGLSVYSPTVTEPAHPPTVTAVEDTYALESIASSGDYLLARGKICDLLYKLLFPDKRPNVGLILIAGATSSGKSNIARGLVKLYLDQRIADVATRSQGKNGFKNTERRPHLVTIENPIEQYRFIAKGTGRPEDPSETQWRLGLDYTPREIGKDVKDLHQALMVDALRQTPSVVYVGELRTDGELKTALQFATTGHLIVSTMHAGSLVEAMERTFAAMEVKTAQDRGKIASLILGLIHLRAFEIEDLPDKLLRTDEPLRHLKVASPAIWRGTSQGVASVVADGLSALLPNRPQLRSDPSNIWPACIGRTAIIEQLCPESNDDSSLAPWWATRRKNAIMSALEEDIKGV